MSPLLVKDLGKLGLLVLIFFPLSLSLLAEGSCLASYIYILYYFRCDNLESRFSCRLNSVLQQHVPGRLCQVEDAFLVLFFPLYV
jgi:hypothetical protein